MGLGEVFKKFTHPKRGFVKLIKRQEVKLNSKLDCSKKFYRLQANQRIQMNLNQTAEILKTRKPRKKRLNQDQVITGLFYASSLATDIPP